MVDNETGNLGSGGWMLVLLLIASPSLYTMPTSMLAHLSSILISEVPQYIAYGLEVRHPYRIVPSDCASSLGNIHNATSGIRGWSKSIMF